MRKYQGAQTHSLSQKAPWVRSPLRAYPEKDRENTTDLPVLDLPSNMGTLLNFDEHSIA